MSDDTAPAPQPPTSAAGTTPTPAAAPDANAPTADQLRMMLRRVKDPELNLNIIDLGLVYDVRVEGTKAIVDMTLTSPGCPSGPEIMTAAEEQLRELPGLSDIEVNLVWSPMWTPDRIEPRIKAYLGF